MVPILLASLIITIASLVGSISLWEKLGKLIERNLHYLISFSAGTFIIISYNLVNEAMEHSRYTLNIFAWIIIGTVLSLIIFRLIPDFHHHHDNEEEGEPHNKLDARRIILSDAMHNIGDGVLLSASFLANFSLGISITLGIFIHELAKGLSKFFVLRQAMYSIKESLVISYLTSSTILIGSIIGYFLLDKYSLIEAPILGLTAGILLIVVLHDLIPHSISSIKNNSHIAKHIAWAVLGIVIMIILGMVMGHE
ncbi:MAG TPA: ZIP family metal transporter [Candidatus Paceibacterota bacterium]